MDSPQTLANVCTQDTGRRQTNKSTTQKDDHHEPRQTPGVNPGAREE
jgi:hypothetical protein